MNIPLNIDWQQILLHMLNFSILTLGMYVLLYNPVKNFMDARAVRYNKVHVEASEKLEQAEALKQSYEQRLANIDKELEAHKAQAMQEAETEVKKILQDAEEQAAKMIAHAQATAKLEREKILEDVQQEITDMAISATERLLAQSTSDAFDEFLDSVEKGV